MSSVIKKCSCKGNAGVAHAANYQNQKYGQDNRVMNANQEGKEFTCTVCGAKHK